MPVTFRDCGCVLILGQVVLAPVFMSIITLLVMFTGNFLMTIARIKLGKKERTEGQTLGDLVWQSVRVPSLATLVPALAVHVVHFLKLVAAESTFAGVYANWVNSGMMAFLVAGLYGAALSTIMFDPEHLGVGSAHYVVDITKPVTFRLLSSVVLFALQLPAFMRYTSLAAVRWCWLVLPLEVVSALMVQVFFPDAATMMAAYHRGCRDGLTGRLTTPSMLPNVVFRLGFGITYLITFALFPLQEVMNVVAPYIRIKQVTSPVGPILRTLLLSLFCLMKTWEMQFLFTFELLFENGVGYLDAITLSYTARHMECSTCLLSASFQHEERSILTEGTTAAAIAKEALYQLVGFLA